MNKYPDIRCLCCVVLVITALPRMGGMEQYMSDVGIVVGGLVIVFLGMVAIVGLLYLISGTIRLFSKKKKSRQEENTAAEIGAGASTEEYAQAAEDTSDEELAAVIAAAVAAYTGDSGASPRFRVTSFKRVSSRGGRG